ncbi:MAG: hypothetical protein FIA95_14900, partial [Gemmatimonadetes bacterium]|nr:hypothetical protein [Gemmatimonadota bacterium]
MTSAAGTRDSSGHALEVLEFRRVLERVAQRASCGLARERILGLAPGRDPDAIRRELARVGAAMRFAEEKPAWGLPAVPDARTALRHLSAEGAVLEPLQLHGLGTLLQSSRLVASEMDGRQAGHEDLAAVRARLVQDRSVEEALARAVDGEGNVLDTASKELRRIRDRLRGAHARIVRQLESYLRSLPERFVVPDASVTI